MPPSLSTLAAKLSDRLERSTPGSEAHLKMAPRSSPRQENLKAENRDCREAGVLILLLPAPDGPVLVLTARRKHLSDHAGQISFPGGQRENDEALRTTALREAEEEIGIDSDTIRILGRLTRLYIPPSNFCVSPFVGIASHLAELRPTDQEVERILRVPLAHLLDPSARRTETRFLQGSDVEVPYYDVSGHTVWGATAMMLSEFLWVVRDVLPSSDESSRS